MEKLLQKIPFLRILICFVSGIILADSFAGIFGYVFVLVLLFIILLFLIIKFNNNFTYFQIYSFLLSALILFCGYVYFESFNKKIKCVDGEYYCASLLEKPIKKENSYKSELRLKEMSISGLEKALNETVIAYFKPDSILNTLHAGDRILFSTSPSYITNNGNPYEFDYQKYLSRKRIYRQVYLTSGDWKSLPSPYGKPLTTYAKIIREKLLSIYLENNITDERFAILSALTLGYKDVLDPEVKSVFSSAGAMHVLAVSGLHVGIIYLIINFMFGFLKKRKIGRLIFVIFSIASLWIYALVTGMSPSVLRAATMFSFLVFGENIRRPVNIYNSLAASAFLLLMINPNFLFEVGFQLSYCAVVGIVFFQPKFYKLITFNGWLQDKLWGLFTVSLAAQISTFPFSIYYFNQFPTYAWLSNFIVIPGAFIFIFLGIAILVFSPISFISGILGEITSYLLDLLYAFLSAFKYLPYYVIKGIYISKEQLFLFLVIIILIMIYITNKRVKYLGLILISLCVIFANNIVYKFNNQKQKEIILYNAGRSALIHLIDGKKNYILSEKPVDEKMEYIFRNVQLTKKLNLPVYLELNKPYEDSCLYMASNVISFHGKNILYVQKNKPLPHFPIDLLICNSDSQVENIDKEVIITYNPYLKKTNKNAHIHCIQTDGAYIYRF